MFTDLLKKYSGKILFENICTNFNLSDILLLDDAAEYRYQFSLYEEYILSKINLLIEQCTFILIEKEYTESVWKEIYSLHYAHTSYSSSNKVMRIHFFTNGVSSFKEKTKNTNVLEKTYLGYITLRPVPDFNLMLSFVVPNWNVLKYSGNDYMMTCKQVVHITSYAVVINTFPFYSQDTVVTTCAQADIIMFATYTNKKYNHKLIKVNDIQDYMKYSPLPSKGLTAREILEIFRSNGSPADYHLKKKIKKYGIDGVSYNSALSHITNILDSYIESGLPVIVYNSKHVIIIIGHTSKYPKEYIVYDDSGVFLQNVINDNSFIGTVSNKDLFPNNNETTYLICATHSRVYLTAAEYDGFVHEAVKLMDIPSSSIKTKRNIIVDNSDIKSHLQTILSNCKDLGNQVKEDIKNLITSDLPHYLWYTELHLFDNSMIVLIGDTTYPVNTHLNIFRLWFEISSDFQLKLLTHITN